MKRTGNKRGLLLAVLLPLLGAAQPGGGTNPDTTKPVKHEFTIQQAVDYAKKNNLNVKNALLDVQYQEQVNKEITSRAYPGINASLSTTYNPNVATQVLPNFISPSTYQVLIDQGVKDGNGNPIQMPADFGFIAAQFGTKYSASAGIALSQLLFDGQVFVGLQARDATMRFARKNVEVTEEMIKTNIYKIYYQLVVSKTQVELLEANIQRLEKLEHDTKIIFENGFAEKLDVDKLNVALTNLRTEKGKVMNSISNGYYGLKVLMGMPVKDELVLTDLLTEEQIKDGILEASIYKYEDRKDFQYAQIGKELNEYNIKRYKLSQIPTISLSGQYAKNAQRNKWNFLGKGDWFTISSVNLNMSIPIFNGFYTKSKIQQTRIDLRKTENQIEALKLSIDSEVETAKNNYRSAISTMDYQKKNMELAETVYQQTKKKYEVGTGSQTEINAAQVELKTAQTSYITALYDAVIARIDFLKATGKL
ncbi:MAG TPA: TolC family protein [Chitinophagaceae bacterium]|nr:TolC family protein [Chitinophagaceae bacterium]